MMPQHPVMSLSQLLGFLLLPCNQPACFKAPSLPAQPHADCTYFPQELCIKKVRLHLLRLCIV